MKQFEAVIKVMEDNGGYATLGLLYQNVLKVRGCKWETKTPYASIRRIVQDKRHFFKIRPGLWALKSRKKSLPINVFPAKEQEFGHAYYQGLLVELGNLKRFKTFVPNQDRNRIFLDKKLGNITTMNKMVEFGFDHIIKKTQTIDVCWFNPRQMPDSLFEVEHSTDFTNSLIKFVELQDFNANFFIVADKSRERAFSSKRSFSTFMPIKKRVKFLSYDQLSVWHSRAYDLTVLEGKIYF